MKLKENLKEKWPKLKNTIIDLIKFIIFTITTTMGFLLIFCMIWTAVGLPATNGAMWLMFFLALSVDWLYIKWLSN